MAKRLLAFGLIMAFVLASPASAAVHSQTSYNYFAVRGKTAREIYMAMVLHGAHTTGADSMASTNVSLSQRPVVTVKPACKMDSFAVDLKFRINLPRLENQSALAPATRRSWTLFSATLKAHEEHHRSIWLGCAERLSRQALSIKAGDCARFKASYAAISKGFLAQCSAENEAFDAKERARFMTLPFIRQLVRNKASAAN